MTKQEVVGQIPILFDINTVNPVVTIFLQFPSSIAAALVPGGNDSTQTLHVHCFLRLHTNLQLFIGSDEAEGKGGQLKLSEGEEKQGRKMWRKSGETKNSM